MDITRPGALSRLRSELNIRIEELKVYDPEYWSMLLASAKTKEGAEHALDTAMDIQSIHKDPDVLDHCENVINEAGNSLVRFMQN